MKIGLIIGIVGLVMFVMTCGIINIHPTECAVEVNKFIGKVMDMPKGVGYHLYNRWVTDMVTYKVAARAYPGDVESSEKSDKYNLDLKTNDGQNIDVDLTIIYALRTKEVPRLHAEVGRNYQDEVLLPQIRSEARLVVGSYEAEQIYQGKVRDEIQQAIKQKLQLALAKYPAIQIQDALLRSFSFSKDFERKIEEKKLAAQQVEINKNKAYAQEEEAKRMEAEARGDKLKKIQVAEGEAQSRRVIADAERYSLEQEAKGKLAIFQSEAEGKRLAAVALGGGHNVVALKFAENIPDKFRIFGIPIGENSTSLMDLNGVLKGLFEKVE